jgi:hypothetical protein
MEHKSNQALQEKKSIYAELAVERVVAINYGPSGITKTLVFGRGFIADSQNHNTHEHVFSHDALKIWSTNHKTMLSSRSSSTR